MPEISKNAAIYSAFLQHCRRPVFLGHWRRLTPDAATYLTPADDARTLGSLREQFGDEPVIASRIAAREEDGEWRMLSGVSAGKLVVALRDGGQTPHLDVLTADGCLSRDLPILVALGDGWTRSRLLAQPSYDRVLFVVFNVAEVALLRALGLAATFAGPPERIRAKHLAMLSSEHAPRIAVVGWRPQSLAAEAPPDFQQWCAHLAGFESHLGADIGNFSAWMPSTSEVDAIRFALEYGDIDDARALFLDVTSHYGLSAAATGSVDPEARSLDANSILEPWRRLRELRSTHPDDAALRDEAWRELEQRVERDLVAPAFRAALAEPDPARRDLLLSGAELARLRHPLAARLADRLLELFRTPPQTWHTAFPARELAVLLTITNRALAVHRELHRGPDRPGGSSWRRWSQK